MKKLFPPDLSLYLVLDAALCGNDPNLILQVASEALLGGVTVIQLRARELSKKDTLSAARKLSALLKDTNVPFIVNDHPDIALLVGADGVHLGQSDMPVGRARELLGKDKIIGLSISDMGELKKSDLSFTDYIGVGPVFSTSTKTDAAPPCGLEGLSEITCASRVPAVAIGGIHDRNAALCISSGAEGVAVASAICSQPDPRAASGRLLKIVLAALKEKKSEQL